MFLQEMVAIQPPNEAILFISGILEQLDNQVISARVLDWHF